MAARLASRGTSSLARVPTSRTKTLLKSSRDWPRVSSLDARRPGDGACSSSPVTSNLGAHVISQSVSQPRNFDVRRSQSWYHSNHQCRPFPNRNRRKTTNAVSGVEGMPSTVSTSQGASEKDQNSTVPYWEKENPDWTIKMLYDGDCPLCMREVDMLRKRNETYRSIAFVNISGDDYNPEDHAGTSFEDAMGRIHAIKRDGTVFTNVDAFRELYEAVGLGFVYAITRVPVIRRVVDVVYEVWAKYRLPITGRPPMAEILEARLRQKGEAPEMCRDKKSGKETS